MLHAYSHTPQRTNTDLVRIQPADGPTQALGAGPTPTDPKTCSVEAPLTSRGEEEEEEEQEEEEEEALHCLFQIPRPGVGGAGAISWYHLGNKESLAPTTYHLLPTTTNRLPTTY